MGSPWIAFFSQTGSEIADLSEALGRWPDVVVTNTRPENLRTIDSRITEIVGDDLIFLPNKPTVKSYKAILHDKDAIVTLHGWLRVMPPELCEKFKMFNGHPGLITDYPELKGKDPQVRTWEGIKEGKYTTAGCVIHRVTAGVDEGEVLSFERFSTWDIKNLNELFNVLKDRSLYLWINLLTGIVVDK